MVLLKDSKNIGLWWAEFTGLGPIFEKSNFLLGKYNISWWIIFHTYNFFYSHKLFFMQKRHFFLCQWRFPSPISPPMITNKHNTIPGDPNSYKNIFLKNWEYKCTQSLGKRGNTQALAKNLKSWIPCSTINDEACNLIHDHQPLNNSNNNY